MASQTSDTMHITFRVVPVTLTDGSVAHDVHIDNGSGAPMILSAINERHANALVKTMVFAIVEHTTDTAQKIG